MNKMTLIAALAAIASPALAAPPTKAPAKPAAKPTAPGFEWTGGIAVAESNDPRARAMADLCHVLLNSNEFIYLH